MAPTALVPVTAAQVRMILKVPESTDPRSVVGAESIVKDREEVVHILNAVLDTLAARPEDRLLGPTELERLLKDAAAWEKVHVYLDDPGDMTETWKTRGLSAALSRCGAERFVVIDASLEAAPLSTGYEGFQWRGSISVRARLFPPSTPGTPAVANGWAEFWGFTGIVGGHGAALPLSLGKTLGRAADQALRTALSQLLGGRPRDGSLP